MRHQEHWQAAGTHYGQTRIYGPTGLAGADDLYTARAANRQPARAGCEGVTHRKLAGVDDLFTARAANR